MTGSHGLFEAGLDKTQANFAPLTLLGLLQRAAKSIPSIWPWPTASGATAGPRR